MKKTTPLSIFLLATAALLVTSCATKVPGTWTPLETQTGDAFYTINFVSPNEGWLNGQTDRSFVSPEDDNANANSNQKPKPVASENKKERSDHGKKPEDPLKANEGFEVLHTTDSGKTWSEIPDLFKYKIRSVWFVDPRIGWALTIDHDILNSTDGGQTWTQQRKAGTVKLILKGNLRNPETDQPEQIEHIYFVDKNHGWAWGGGKSDEYTEQPGIFLTTVNGGQNWNKVTYPFTQDVLGIFFLDNNRAWASTKDGFYRTTDSGLNWAKIETRLPEIAFTSICFIDDQHGWVVGRSGRMAKTTDGGKTWWKMVDIKNDFKMQQVYFLDKNQGWAVGSFGDEQAAILYSADAGDTWVSVEAPAPRKLMSVVFVGGNTGWAAGLGGSVLRFDPSSGKH